MSETAADKSPFRHERADDSAGFLLWKITALWQQKLSGVLGDFGITQTQYAILASLKWFEGTGEPPTQAHLAQHTKIDKMTLSKSIRKLESAGFVARKASRRDSRAVQVAFTSRGKAMIARAVVAIEDADDAFFSALSPTGLREYKRLTVEILSRNSLATD